MIAAKRWKVPAALGVAGVAVVGASWFGLRATGAVGGDGDAFVAPPVADAAPAVLSIPNGAANVTPGTPLVLTAPVGETIGSVTVADAQAHSVAGTYSADRRTWTSLSGLRVADTYAVTAATVDAHNNGMSLQHSSFSTAQEQNAISLDSVFPQDGSTDGVGQPVVVSFTNPVQNKAAVERALSVYSSPPQQGSWGWVSDTRIDFRPQNYWSTGTKVSVQLNLDGAEVAPGQYGTEDRSMSFTIGRDQETVVNVASHQATVYRSGQAVHHFSISAGMPGLDTWGGTFAVIDKASDVNMNSETVGLGAAYDVPDVQWDVHLTDSGTYIHSAPWSVGSQGYENVSHGCIGTNPTDAEWFYDSSLPGDIVKVVNSPRTAGLGNGYNDWTLSWADWQGKSAL